MSQQNNQSWGGQNGANVNEQANAAAKQNPFGGAKSGPPVFYRSKTQGTEGEAPTQAPAASTNGAQQQPAPVTRAPPMTAPASK